VILKSLALFFVIKSAQGITHFQKTINIELCYDRCSKFICGTINNQILRSITQH